MRARLKTGLLAAVTLCLAVPGPAHAALEPLGLACSFQNGVRFCPGNGTDQRIPSWDGTPLDADVTLPPTGNGPWPTIVFLQGLGGHKRQLEPYAPQPGPGRAPKVLPSTYHYNNVWFAQQGYAVLAYSSRGFGNSCSAGGAPASLLQTGTCSQGFIRLADTRYEGRDSQYLLGLLVDEGITSPHKLAATGFSYGGGMALELGYLKDRIRCAGENLPHDPCDGHPDGAYIPWTSPRGVPMSMAAVYGQWMWSDLISAVLPNGRFLDFDTSTDGSSLQPLGVETMSYTNALYALGNLDGYVEAPQLPGSRLAPWDLTTAIARLGAGEPYRADVQAIAGEYSEFHGGYGIPGRPAALLLEDGWNDDFFPPAQALRTYNDVRMRYPGADVALLLGDYGHGRSANKPTVAHAFNDAVSAFFAAHLLGRRGGPPPGSVVVYTSTCPTSGPGAPPDGGPFAAATWAQIHSGSVTLGGAATQTVSSSGGDPSIGMNFDPIPSTDPFGTSDPCKTIPAEDPSGEAIYKLRSPGFTMLGLPTIRATVATTGANGQLDGRLWDVLPDGRQRLVNRGGYRLTSNQSGQIVFQLHGNGYTFPAGDTIKLELVAGDAPYYRASNGSFTVRVSGVSASLPVLAPAGPCTGHLRVALPHGRGVRVVSVTVYRGHRRIRTVRGRSVRGRSVLIRRLPAGRVRVRAAYRVPGGHVHTRTRSALVHC
jgi:dienelactone hydrolase